MKRLAGIVLAGLLVGACSSGSSSSGSTSTSATTVTTVLTTTTQDLAGDKQAASNVVITAADAGPGFRGTAHDRTTDDDLASCVNHDPVLSGTEYPTQVDGEDLSNTSAASETDVQSSVRVAPTVEAAMASMAAIKTAGVLPCITDVIKSSATTNGVTVSGLTVSALAVPALGDDVFAFKVVGTIAQSGTTIHSTEYALLVRKGRVLGEMSVNGLNVVPGLSLATRLATTMVTRASAIH